VQQTVQHPATHTATHCLQQRRGAQPNSPRESLRNMRTHDTLQHTATHTATHIATHIATHYLRQKSGAQPKGPLESLRTRRRGCPSSPADSLDLDPVVYVCIYIYKYICGRCEGAIPLRLSISLFLCFYV
jgi:hypothetical protein